MDAQLLTRLAGFAGASGVAVGAFGAHALKKTLEQRDSVSTFQTGVQYRELCCHSAGDVSGVPSNVTATARRPDPRCGAGSLGKQYKKGAWDHRQAVGHWHRAVFRITVRTSAGWPESAWTRDSNGWLVLHCGVVKPRDKRVKSRRYRSVLSTQGGEHTNAIAVLLV